LDLNDGTILLEKEKNSSVMKELDRNLAIVAKEQLKSNKKIYLHIKRFIDILLSSIGIVILSPVFFILACVVKLDSKGPVFFAHTRIGKNGKKFKMYKFRTMHENAQEMIKDFSEEQKKEFNENFKLENDPRITRVGGILRKTSLDELPQLVNILKGDLSIIGPRPIINSELEKYGVFKEKFLSVTPGLTGYWQANGRSNTTYEERMQMELYYVDNYSFSLDIRIFFKTILTVLKREGAV